jgi:succinoglycan biosynthesis protein ExoA
MEAMSSQALPVVEFMPLSRGMIVIPCLNEAAHIEKLLEKLNGSAERFDMKIVVVDGGSTDGTLAILEKIAVSNARLIVLDNPQRIQSAAINLAVRELGDEFDFLIRVDAHGDYPGDYCDRLIEEAEITAADSVVVGMATEGFDAFQKATAIAQNSKLGNGGAKHREGAEGHWTDHGHHALMRIDAYREVGGYDETFTHNEDAELDYRLRKNGYRIWMTDRTVMTYYPRSTASALFRQYLGYGKGRAKNMLKHGTRPKLRQALPLLVVPMVAGASLGLVSSLAAVPALLWAGICIGYGIYMALSERKPYAWLAGIPAMVMHFAWSAGFWLQLLKSFSERKVAR